MADILDLIFRAAPASAVRIRKGETRMSIETVQMIGVVSSLMSCGFWIAGAGVRIKPLSLFTLRGPDSIPETLQRQSLMNAIAAIFAAGAAGAQAMVFYLSSSN